jgi:hypothetical protein
MSGAKSRNKNAKPAGIDAINLANTEANKPHTWFAGTRALNVTWIMTPVISRVTNSSGSGKGK